MLRAAINVLSCGVKMLRVFGRDLTEWGLFKALKVADKLVAKQCMPAQKCKIITLIQALV